MADAENKPPRGEPDPPDAGEPVIQPRRKAAPSRDAAEEQDRAADLSHLADSVKALSARLGDSLHAAAAPPRPEPEPRASRRWKRTHGSEAPLAPAPAKSGERPPPLPGAPAARAARPRRPARNQRKRRPLPIAGLLGAQAFGFLLVLVGYLLGHTDRAPTASGAGTTAASAPAPPFFRGVSERAFQAVNSAMAAAKRGDAAAARQTLEGVQHDGLGIPGVDYRLALLAIARGDLKEAKLRLDCAMAANEELAGCSYVRAMLAGAIGDYNRASEECSRAAFAEPFSARYLFFWAECQRRNGRMREALARFGEALTRPATAAEVSFIEFKMRLTMIEAGRAGEFAPELARRLAAAPGDPYWIVTAAALALEGKDLAKAAEHLQRASRLMPPADFDLVLRDYLLVMHANEKEVSPFFQRGIEPASPSPNVAAITVDPLSWSLQSADPGAWPSAVSRGR